MLPGIYDIFQERWGKGQSCYIYSDPHFNDKDLTCGVRNRPSAEEQIKKINSKCGRKDTFICLGDVGDLECVRKLRAAYKVLIMGNHDAGATNYKRVITHKVFDADRYTKDQVREIMEKTYPGWKINIKAEISFQFPFNIWVAEADNQLFDEVYEGAVIIGEKLILSHEPVNIPWAFNIHGHIHNSKKKNDSNHLNICCDAYNYELLNLNQFLKQGYMSKIETVHRTTIDSATERKRKRGGKKICDL